MPVYSPKPMIPAADTQRKMRSACGALLASCGYERGEPEDQRNDADADREGARRPVAEHEDAVLPVGGHAVPLLRVVARGPR